MSDPRVADVIRMVHEAWTVQGPRPDYHRQAQIKLGRDWPRLAQALDALEQAMAAQAPGMTADELITDLDGRIDRAIVHLTDQADATLANPQTSTLNERIRLLSKANGLQVVKDWLRGYR